MNAVTEAPPEQKNGAALCGSNPEEDTQLTAKNNYLDSEVKADSGSLVTGNCKRNIAQAAISNTAAATTADVTDHEFGECADAAISSVTDDGSAEFSELLIGNRASCAGCKRKLEPGAPVYRTRLLVPWSFYFHGQLQKGASWKHRLVCEACIGAEKGRYRKSHSCLACGRPLFIWRRGVQCADYCSHGCQLDAANARRRQRSATRRGAQRRCVICGEAFTPKRTDSEYCSAACKQAAYRQRLKANATPKGQLI